MQYFLNINNAITRHDGTLYREYSPVTNRWGYPKNVERVKRLTALQVFILKNILRIQATYIGYINNS